VQPAGVRSVSPAISRNFLPPSWSFSASYRWHVDLLEISPRCRRSAAKRGRAGVFWPCSRIPASTEDYTFVVWTLEYYQIMD
jgi:hypothetical protein